MTVKKNKHPGFCLHIQAGETIPIKSLRNATLRIIEEKEFQAWLRKERKRLKQG